MNRTASHRLAGLLFGALVAIVALPAAAADCAAPKGIGEVRGCAAAQQGSDELRRFVQRTQSIYLLGYWQFAAAVPRPAETAAAAPIVVAQE